MEELETETESVTEREVLTVQDGKSGRGGRAGRGWRWTCISARANTSRYRTVTDTKRDG